MQIYSSRMQAQANHWRGSTSLCTPRRRTSRRAASAKTDILPTAIAAGERDKIRQGTTDVCEALRMQKENIRGVNLMPTRIHLRR